jgi:hypothetical protein
MTRYLSICFLLIVVISPFLFSQQLSQMRVVGKAEFQSGELVTKEVRDANGEVCAGLIIATDLDGLKFDSYNGVVKMNADKPGTYFLFLSPDERVVTVYKTGFGPLKLILSEYGISKMQSGKVWQLNVTGEKKLELIPVNILIEPTVDKISIDGKQQPLEKTYQLAPGEHSLRIEKDGYKTIEEKITVSISNTLFNFKLSEVELIGITIRSIPTSAKIFIDNAEKGETDKGMFLYPGSFNLKLVKSGYLDAQQTIEVKEKSEKVFFYTLVRNAGTLTLSVQPADARVLINREDCTNRTNVELAPGKYKLEIEKTGYNSVSEMIDILLGKTTIKQYSLVAKTGSLQFNVTPVDAKVRLLKSNTEVLSWKGMRAEKNLPVGEYVLEISAEGYAQQIKHIQISERRINEEEISLEKTIVMTQQEIVSLKPEVKRSFHQRPSVLQAMVGVGGIGAMAGHLNGSPISIVFDSNEDRYGSSMGIFFSYFTSEIEYDTYNNLILGFRNFFYFNKYEEGNIDIYCGWVAGPIIAKYPALGFCLGVYVGARFLLSPSFIISTEVDYGWGLSYVSFGIGLNL